MVPPLSEKKWLFFTKLGKRVSEKVGFYLLFEPILGGGFLDQIIASFKQKIHLFLCVWLFGCCIFTILPKYYLEGRFSTTIITIFNARLQ